jgi:hypothetical protein
MRPIFAVTTIAVCLLPPSLLAQEFVTNYLAPDGSEIRIEVGVRFPKRVQQLKAKTIIQKGLPVLHQDSSTRGKVASLINGDKLTIWQLPASNPAGSPSARSATRATISLSKRSKPNKPNRTITPSWWPRLEKPWSRQATDEHSVTTTLMGWSRSGVASTRTRIVAAAARAGLSISELGQNTGRPRDGDLAFFTGSRKEMMVTFSRIGGRTGVVAHLTEAKR